VHKILMRKVPYDLSYSRRARMKSYPHIQNCYPTTECYLKTHHIETSHLSFFTKLKLFNYVKHIVNVCMQ